MENNAMSFGNFRTLVVDCSIYSPNSFIYLQNSGQVTYLSFLTGKTSEKHTLYDPTKYGFFKLLFSLQLSPSIREFDIKNTRKYR